MALQGFTLIECSLVCVLCLLVVTLTCSGLSWLQRFEVQTHMEVLHTACLYIQQAALAQHEYTTITFDDTKHTYTVDGRVVVLPSYIRFGVAPGIKGPPGDPKHSITKGITFPHNTITCTPYGVIQPGTVYFVDTRSQIVYALSCAIAQVSYVRKYRYDGMWRMLA